MKESFSEALAMLLLAGLSYAAAVLPTVAESKPTDPLSILYSPVCYKVDLGDWAWVSGEKGPAVPQPSPDWIPPSRIMLDVRPPILGDNALTVWPDGVDAGSPLFYLGEWEAEPSGLVHVSWSRGFSSIRMHIPQLTEEVQASVEVWSDVIGAPRPGCVAHLRKVRCRDWWWRLNS